VIIKPCIMNVSSLHTRGIDRFSRFLIISSEEGGREGGDTYSKVEVVIQATCEPRFIWTSCIWAYLCITVECRELNLLLV